MIGHFGRLCVCTLTLLLVVGCARIDVPATLRTPQAGALIDQYLRALAGESPDYGWSLLHRDARQRVIGGMGPYVAQAKAAKWDQAHWSVADVRRDDNLYCARLDVLQGDVPVFLTWEKKAILSRFLAKLTHLVSVPIWTKTRSGLLAANRRYDRSV